MVGCAKASYTKAVKPKKAKDKRPATNKLIGTPFIPSGMFASSNCSRILAKTIKANANPIEFEIAKNTAFIKLLSSNPNANIATPKTAQLVVIKGRKTPNA